MWSGQGVSGILRYTVRQGFYDCLLLCTYNIRHAASISAVFSRQHILGNVFVHCFIILVVDVELKERDEVKILNFSFRKNCINKIIYRISSDIMIDTLISGVRAFVHEGRSSNRARTRDFSNLFANFTIS